jgi:hypothetical protein
MKKITTFIIAATLLFAPIFGSAQSSGEREQFLQNYKRAVEDKTAIIKAEPALYQEALNSNWFQQVASGLKNAEDYANGNKGGSAKGPSTINGLCSAAIPFCTESGSTYPAGVNTGTGQVGPNYACLLSTPNPAWYFLKIAVGGSITILETNSGNKDVDFCLWGPFDSPDACNSLTGDKVVDCSYHPQAVEYIDIASAIPGKYYILLITNFSNLPTDITLAKVPGSGPATTDCSITLVPMAPTATAASGVGSAGFQANWLAAVADPYPATSYVLDVSTVSTFASFVPGYNGFSVGNVLTFPVSGLSAGTTYYYRLRGVNGTGQSPNSNYITVNTSGAPSVPISNWALYFGIFLIVVFSAIRFRKMI